MRPRPRPNPKSGLTALELLLGMSMVVVTFVVAGTALRDGLATHEGARLQEVAASKARRGLERAREELAAAGLATLFPDPFSVLGTDWLVFNEVTGVSGGAPTWAPTQRLGFEYARDEIDNGVDDDGNGVVDDGLLVLTRDLGLAGEVEVVLCSSVRELLEGEEPNGEDDNGNGLIDEAGFCARIEGGVLVLRLSTELRNTKGEVAVATAETGIDLRN